MTTPWTKSRAGPTVRQSEAAASDGRCLEAAEPFPHDLLPSHQMGLDLRSDGRLVGFCNGKWRRRAPSSLFSSDSKISWPDPRKGTLRLAAI